jgi:amino acid permease
MFAFLMQHSLPSIAAKCNPEKKIKKYLRAVYFFSLISILAISYLAIGAFGGKLAVN